MISKKRESQKIDKTVIRHPLPVNEKTKVTKEKTLVKIETENEEVETDTSVPQAPSEEINLLSEDLGTQVVNIKEFLPSLKQEVIISEKEFSIDENQDQEEEKDGLHKAKEHRNKISKKDTEKKSEKIKKKPMKPIIALAFIALFYFVFLEDQEENKAIEPKAVLISFPSPYEYENVQKSTEEYELGLKALGSHTYLAKVVAAEHFNRSLSHKFSDNPSLPKLILVDAELLPNVANPIESAKNLNRLLKIAHSKVLTDVDIATGTAVFYYHNEKYKTAVNTFKNFLRLEDNKKRLSPKFFAFFLESLIKVGEFEEAKKVFDILSKAPRKSVDTYIALARFLEYNENYKEAEEILNDANKKIQSSVALLLEYAKVILNLGDYKKFKAVLEAVNELKAEECPSYFGKYLEYMGILSSIKNDTKTASLFFNNALKYNESDELRSKLAALEVGGNEGAQSLIIESKIIDLMNRAKIEMEKKNWDQAIAYAISASDLSQTYIPSKLLLAKIQIERGYFDFAISTLLELRKNHSYNDSIISLLLEAYIESYKFDDAQKEINSLSKSKFAHSYKFPSLLAKFYKKQNNIPLAIRWLQEAINRNPINDADYFQMADTLLYLRKYSDAQKMLSDAMALDPDNLDYKVAEIKILYELKGVDSAIGYIRDQLTKYPDSPKLIGEIAKYYYKSNQMKYFEAYKTKLEAMDKKDPSFYLFMIEASKKDDKNEEAIKYSRELLKVQPGNLTVRMSLGDYFMALNRLNEALYEFEQVKIRLPTYPKVHYYMAKAYLQMHNLEKSQENAELEIASNPTIENGYYILGEVFKAKEDWQAAVKNFEKAISKNGKSVEALAGLAWIRHKQNQHAAARELYLRALKQDLNNPHLHKGLGYVYKDMGQSSLAIDEFTVYLTLSPNAPDRQQIESEIAAIR